jgi:hypothetical protein
VAVSGQVQWIKEYRTLHKSTLKEAKAAWDQYGQYGYSVLHQPNYISEGSNQAPNIVSFPNIVANIDPLAQFNPQARAWNPSDVPGWATGPSVSPSAAGVALRDFGLRKAVSHDGWEVFEYVRMKDDLSGFSVRGTFSQLEDARMFLTALRSNTETDEVLEALAGDE